MSSLSLTIAATLLQLKLREIKNDEDEELALLQCKHDQRGLDARQVQPEYHLWIEQIGDVVGNFRSDALRFALNEVCEMVLPTPSRPEDTLRVDGCVLKLIKLATISEDIATEIENKGSAFLELLH